MQFINNGYLARIPAVIRITHVWKCTKRWHASVSHTSPDPVPENGRLVCQHSVDTLAADNR